LMSAETTVWVSLPATLARRRICSSGKDDTISQDSDDPNRAVTVVGDLAPANVIGRIACLGISGL